MDSARRRRRERDAQLAELSWPVNERRHLIGQTTVRVNDRAEASGRIARLVARTGRSRSISRIEERHPSPQVKERAQCRRTHRIRNPP